MLVITALVGSKGLEQIIYIGLTSADFGKDIIAGFGMALIAMIADRIIQAWSIQQKTALGIIWIITYKNRIKFQIEMNRFLMLRLWML